MILRRVGRSHPTASNQPEKPLPSPVLQEAHCIALLIPLCGTAGLWSPSCIASAQVAVEELNREAGIKGRNVELIMIDSAIEAPTPVEKIVNVLIANHTIDAIVGMHISTIRQRLREVVRQRVPYIYTPLYEGGEQTPGIFPIGETPNRQLVPAMDFLHNSYRLKRWALIGNDYIWPRVSHVVAKREIRELSASLVYERYLPFGFTDIEQILDKLNRSNADGVLLSLIGQDAVLFNRSFGELALDRKMVRLSCAMEENELLASGADGLRRLFSSASYFGVLRTEANAAFRERYYGLHGDSAPLLNVIGQSIYEGVHFLASLIADHGDQWRGLHMQDMSCMSYPSARLRRHGGSGQISMPVYLARADGIQFAVIKSL